MVRARSDTVIGPELSFDSSGPDYNLSLTVSNTWLEEEVGVRCTYTEKAICRTNFKLLKIAAGVLGFWGPYHSTKEWQRRCLLL